MRATDLLRKQHAEAQILIERLRDADSSDARQTLRAELVGALRAHMQLEEEHIYTRLDSNEQIEDLIDDSFSEHEELKDALVELERADLASDELDAILDEVEDDVLAHAAEEEAELLPWLESVWGDDVLEDMGEIMEQRFQSLTHGGEGTELVV
jgi:hemerythrin superfamily protein